MHRKVKLATAAVHHKQHRAEPKPDKHGQNRGLPPPAAFDLDALPDSTLLTESEAAAAARFSRNTLQAWRRQPDHPLRFRIIHGGRVRYEVAAVRAFLALGQPRKRKPSPAPAATKTTEH